MVCPIRNSQPQPQCLSTPVFLFKTPSTSSVATDLFLRFRSCHRLISRSTISRVRVWDLRGTNSNLEIFHLIILQSISSKINSAVIITKTCKELFVLVRCRTREIYTVVDSIWCSLTKIFCDKYYQGLSRSGAARR